MTLRSPYLEPACAIGPQISFYTSHLLRPAFLADDKKLSPPSLFVSIFKRHFTATIPRTFFKILCYLVDD
jgi:hypothetical protein